MGGGWKWFDTTTIGGVGIIKGDAWRNGKLSFSLVNPYLLYIYVNSDVTDTFTFELWVR